MGKRIVLCFDGTWNTPESETNVHKLHQALGPDTEEQVSFYYQGVGTEGNPLMKIAGGAAGEGIVDKIREGFDDIAAIYEPGDQIYLFGFSRGAFAARCLAHVIAEYGFPTRYFDSDNPDTSHYNKYLGDVIFDEYKARKRRDDLPQIMKDHCVTGASVKMVGVWDTVGSLGLSAAFGKVNKLRYGYLEPEWHPNIQNSFQALAIDEKRSQFNPVRWRTGPGEHSPNHTMEQVWFPGVHSDVGGGYDHSAQAENALGWMIKRAIKCGLTFDREKIREYAVQDLDDLGVIHESWKPHWGIPKTRDVPGGSKLSGFVTLQQELDLYDPKNLPAGKTKTTVASDGTDLRQKPPSVTGWVPYKPVKTH